MLQLVGVYVGCMYHEYLDIMAEHAPAKLPPQAFIGNGPPYMVGRLSYSFGFAGGRASWQQAAGMAFIGVEGWSHIPRACSECGPGPHPPHPAPRLLFRPGSCTHPAQASTLTHGHALHAGPCVSTDTACSSSLVAAHLAHRGLLDGEAQASVAGGINIMLDPATQAGICQLQVGARVQDFRA